MGLQVPKPYVLKAPYEKQEVNGPPGAQIMKNLQREFKNILKNKNDKNWCLPGTPQELPKPYVLKAPFEKQEVNGPPGSQTLPFKGSLWKTISKWVSSSPILAFYVFPVKNKI